MDLVLRLGRKSGESVWDPVSVAAIRGAVPASIWAELERFALEVLRQASQDSETRAALAAAYLELLDSARVGPLRVLSLDRKTDQPGKTRE